MFNARAIAETFMPRNRTEVAPQEFLRRLAICQRCALRRVHTCRPGRQLVTVLARAEKGRCPVDAWEKT